MLRQHKREYERLQQAFRSANLAARRATEAQTASERAALLAGGDPQARRQRAAAEGGLAAASESVTESLRRTRHMMTQVRGCCTADPGGRQPICSFGGGCGFYMGRIRSICFWGKNCV